MQQYLYIGIGGFFGAILRFLVSSFVQQTVRNHWLPYGTITVNIVGCFLIGFLNGVDHIKQIFSPELRLFIFMGMLGSFTTFATFGNETFELFRNNYPISGIFNIIIQVTIGLFSVWLGSVSAKLVF